MSENTQKKKFTYNDFTYNNFTYGKYNESDAVNQAKTALDTQLANKPGEYQSQWQTQLNDTINKILNRDKFTYDLNGDALYQQYKDKYIQQGKLAMGDAIGQASAMTGGYGNSYAQSVGQQAYQAQLQNLNDIVPELYQMARDKYNMEGQDLYNQFSMLGTQEEMDYGRYRDTVSDWLTERDYLANRYDSERDFDYSKYNNEREFAYSNYKNDRDFLYGVYSDNKNLAYTDYRNSIADEQWDSEYQLALDKFNYEKDQASKVTPGGTEDDDTTTGGGGYDNGALTTNQVKELQKALGVTVDGKYGPETKKAAGNISADDAWAAHMEENKSYYQTSLNDLKVMKDNKKSNAEAQAYLKDMLDEGLITSSEYLSLYNKYRDNKL